MAQQEKLRTRKHKVAAVLHPFPFALYVFSFKDLQEPANLTQGFALK